MLNGLLVSRGGAGGGLCGGGLYDNDDIVYRRLVLLHTLVAMSWIL